MCQVKILGKEKWNEFIQEHVINRKVGFLDIIKKNSLKIVTKSEKK